MSLALNKPLIPQLAMTGEVGLDGSVLMIGGVKEKCQGAQQFGVKTLVIPIGNKFDFLELPENLKNTFVKVYFAKNCDEIYRIGFDLDTSDIDSHTSGEHYLGNVDQFTAKEIFLQENIADELYKH